MGIPVFKIPKKKKKKVDQYFATKNFGFLTDSFLNLDKEGKTQSIRTRYEGVGLEGGSRSGKTVAICDFLCVVIFYMKDLEIVAGRDTRINAKKTIWKEFKKSLKKFGILDDVHMHNTELVITYNGNTVTFVGTNDNPNNVLGLDTDIFWLNETLNIYEDVFTGLNQRCRMFYIIDYNPLELEHWAYNQVDHNNDVAWLKTTMLDNPFVPAKSKRAIESYEPTKENIARGTANKYKWMVYGLGIRGYSELAIFPNVSIFETYPKGWDHRYNGLDFGESPSPNVLVDVIIDGRNLYLTEKFRETSLRIHQLVEFIKPYNNNTTIADNAELGLINELRLKSIKAIPCVKGPFSVSSGIKKLLEYNIFVYKDSLILLSEFKGLKWATDSLGRLKKDAKGNWIPVEGNDHGIDGSRYVVNHPYLRGQTA